MQEDLDARDVMCVCLLGAHGYKFSCCREAAYKPKILIKFKGKNAAVIEEEVIVIWVYVCVQITLISIFA